MNKNLFEYRNLLLSFVLLNILTTLSFSQGVAANSDVVVVRYYRLDNDYKGWTLWTWGIPAQNVNVTKEIQSSGVDKYGLVFVINKKDYHTNQIGFLPKFGDWKINPIKDAPDRIYNPKMGPQVWMVQGDPTLYSTEPDFQALLLLHYYRFDGKYTDWSLWTWGDGKGDSKELMPCGMDKYGAMFMVYKTMYHQKVVGVLPKYQDWKKQDNPDRFYDPGMGNEVWIIQDDSVLYCCGGFPLGILTTGQK